MSSLCNSKDLPHFVTGHRFFIGGPNERLSTFKNFVALQVQCDVVFAQLIAHESWGTVEETEQFESLLASFVFCKLIVSWSLLCTCSSVFSW